MSHMQSPWPGSSRERAAVVFLRARKQALHCKCQWCKNVSTMQEQNKSCFSSLYWLYNWNTLNLGKTRSITPTPGDRNRTYDGATSQKGLTAQLMWLITLTWLPSFQALKNAEEMFLASHHLQKVWPWSCAVTLSIQFSSTQFSLIYM